MAEKPRKCQKNVSDLHIKKKLGVQRMDYSVKKIDDEDKRGLPLVQLLLIGEQRRD